MTPYETDQDRKAGEKSLDAWAKETHIPAAQVRASKAALRAAPPPAAPPPATDLADCIRDARDLGTAEARTPRGPRARIPSAATGA